MNKFFVYVIEAVICFVVVFILHFLLMKLFRLKLNQITSIVFTFVLILFVSFIAAPFVMKFPHPEFFYFTYMIIFLFYDLYKLTSKKSS